MKTNKLFIAAVLAIAIGAPIVGFVGDINMAQPTTPAGEEAAFFHGLGSGPIANQSGLASLERADAWLNSPPLTASALRGKVVLVHFWTYTCINWLRTLPISAPGRRNTRIKGLVVIGVHTPEFRFEKNIDNVRREVKALRVDYPVAVDSEYVIWRAFNNNYWPAQYFIDAQGRVRHHHFGEGSYEQSEMVIQRLLMPRLARAASATTWYLSTRAVLKWPPIGRASSLRKTMLATNVPKALRHRAAQPATNLACMNCRHGCAGTIGRCPATGR